MISSRPKYFHAKQPLLEKAIIIHNVAPQLQFTCTSKQESLVSSSSVTELEVDQHSVAKLQCENEILEFWTNKFFHTKAFEFIPSQTGWNSTNAMLSSKEDEPDQDAVPMHDYPIEEGSDGDEDCWM